VGDGLFSSRVLRSSRKDSFGGVESAAVWNVAVQVGMTLPAASVTPAISTE
jgi:hypothetical protein